MKSATMNAANRSAWLQRLFAALALVASLSLAPSARAQDDDPFGPGAAKANPAADAAPDAEPKAQEKNPTIIRKVDEPSIRKMELLPYQRKEMMQRLIREIQTHLDAREVSQAEEKLAQLLELDLSDAEVRDIRRRFSRFLNVEIDQRVLEMRRRKPQGAANLAEAIRRMLEINRVDEAKRYFGELTALQLTEKERNEIYGLLGESFLRGLIRDRKLGATGAEFAQAIIDTATSKNTTTSPVVAALRSSRLNTPADQLDSIDKLIRYGAIGDAKEIAEQLAKREMTPDEMAELHQQVGSAPLLMLIRDKRLGEAAAGFGRKVLDASSLVSRDPAKLDAAVQKFLTGDVAARRSAAGDLARGGEASVAALLKAISTDKNEIVERALVDLGARALDPLLAATQADSKEVRELAARALARLEAPEARVSLLGPLLDPETSPATRAALEAHFKSTSTALPSREAAKEVLRREWEQAFDSLRPDVTALDTPVHEWTWSAEKKELVYQPMTEGQARRWKLARLSTKLLEVDPTDLEAQRIAAMSLAEAATADAPAFQIADSPSWAIAALGKLPVPALEQGLAEGGRRQRVFALIGLLQLLGKAADEQLLIPTAGEPRIVTKLLAHPHPRVRSQAVETVLKLAPTAAFAGSSQLVEALRGFSQLRARPYVVVVDPKPSRARQASMMLRQSGWEVEMYTSEQELTAAAARLPEVQVLLVSEETTHVGEFLQRVRREPRLALTPVGVMANVENLPGATPLSTLSDRTQATRISSMGANAEALLPVGLQESIENIRKPKDWLHLDRMTRVVPYALSQEVLARMILQLSQLKSDAPLSPEDQLDMAVQSVRWMSFIAGNPSLARIFDLAALETEANSALNHDALAVDAANVVGFVGTAKSQQALVNLANQEQRDLTVRRAAASGFRTAVEKRGLLLTKGDIASQYDRYNQSRDADPEIRKVLGDVLDAIEIPWKKRQALSAAPPR